MRRCWRTSCSPPATRRCASRASSCIRSPANSRAGSRSPGWECRVAYYPEPVARLIDALQRLPGIGPKTAQRLTFYLLKRPAEEVRELGDALVAMKEKITYCRA